MNTVIFYLLVISVVSAFAAWILWEIKNASTEDEEKPYTETICGNCGGPDCVTGCDKEYNPCEVANRASDKLDKDFCEAIGMEPIAPNGEVNTECQDCPNPCPKRFIKPEKDRVVTHDEIRHTAFLIASNDNFSKSPESYWVEAEKQLKGIK